MAVKLMIEEKNTLFDDLFKNLENNRQLYDLTYRISVLGESIQPNIHNPLVNLGFIYGIFRKRNGVYNDIRISNKIYELLIYNYTPFGMKIASSNKCNNIIKLLDIFRNKRIDSVDMFFV